ncbi:MAG: carboxypeptidase-like regulatory domain-containing protein, partial [Flavobacteriales bacterium]|nr:carboxypeptidase-like regulatory domain-containing protein [Flavobacteriales bacterium]
MSRHPRPLLTSLLMLWGCMLHAQRFTVSGYVTDSATGEALIGASVYVQEIGKGVPTNNYGYYSATLDQGTYTLVVRYIGYADLVRAVDLDRDRTVNLRLGGTVQLMKPVEVEAKRGEGNTESTAMGRMDVDVQKLQTLPALLGEVDILKTIQYLPGVKSNGEGNSGFYVRGGGPDQNLI